MKIQDIGVSNLLLDPDNARHGKLAKQSDIITWMLNDSNRRAKLFKLGEDIASAGMNPLAIFAVTPAKEKELFTVLEGNRRTAALHLLTEPSRALPDQAAEKRFTTLAVQGKDVIPATIPCAVFNDTTDARHWLDITHQGELGGIGTVKWGAIEKTRSNLQQGISDKNEFAVTLWDGAVKLGLVDPDLEEKLHITNLTRVLKNEGFRKKFGELELKNGAIYTFLNKAQYEEFVQELFAQITSDHVKDIYSKTDIHKFQEELAKKSSFTKPKNQKKTKHVAAAKSAPLKKPAAKPKKKPVRSKIVEAGFSTLINSDKLQRAFNELSAISTRAYPLSASAAFRMVLEYSTDDYLKENSIPPAKGLKLEQRCGQAIDHMEKSSLMDKEVAKAMRSHVSDKIGVVNVTTLNSYIHNPNYTPTQDALFAGWDDMKPLFAVLLNQK